MLSLGCFVRVRGGVSQVMCRRGQSEVRCCASQFSWVPVPSCRIGDPCLACLGCFLDPSCTNSYKCDCMCIHAIIQSFPNFWFRHVVAALGSWESRSCLGRTKRCRMMWSSGRLALDPSWVSVLLGLRAQGVMSCVQLSWAQDVLQNDRIDVASRVCASCFVLEREREVK